MIIMKRGKLPNTVSLPYKSKFYKDTPPLISGAFSDRFIGNEREAYGKFNIGLSLFMKKMIN